MKTTLVIANAAIEIDSVRELECDSFTKSFAVGSPGYVEHYPAHKIAVEIRDKKEAWAIEKKLAGKELLCLGRAFCTQFYADGEYIVSVRENGRLAPTCYTRFRRDISSCTCYLYNDDYKKPYKLSSILQLLPTNYALTSCGAYILHASRIAVENAVSERGAIAFCAPSGMGKTTQAALWAKNENAAHISGDRVALFESGGGIESCGCPIDGSTPTGRDERARLFAIVMLEKSKRNTVQRLSPINAFKRLISQAVMEQWEKSAQEKVLDFFTGVACSVPVYLLACTKDAAAVTTLKARLMRDGVM